MSTWLKTFFSQLHTLLVVLCCCSELMLTSQESTPHPPHPTDLVLGILVVSGKAVAIVNHGAGVGPGSARSISSASRRESIKIGIFSGGQYCHPFIISDGSCLYLFGLRTCWKANAIFRDFSGRQQYILVIPLLMIG